MREEYDEDLMGVILKIPVNATIVEIYVTYIDKNGKNAECTMTAYPKDIQEFRKDFLDYVGDDDYDALYRLTDKALNELENEK